MIPSRGAARLSLLAALLAVAPVPASAPQVGLPHLGLAIEFDTPPSPDAERKAMEEVRRTGADLFVLTVSWSRAEPSPRKYRLDDVIRTARLLRQSGATVHFDLPLVAGRRRDVPADLAASAFDDPKLSVRLGELLQSLAGALADASTLSLGYEADAYFSDKPDELKAYRRLFDGAVEFLKTLAPRLSVGVTTAAPGESASPEAAAELHRTSPVLFYLYAPFLRDKPFWHRPPDALDSDWKRLLKAASGRPIAFPEVSFSSAAENGSSPERQAEFVRRLRRFLASIDADRVLFARYVTWRDPPAGLYRLDASAPEEARRRVAFFSHRGLQDASGAAKPAWKVWIRAGR